MRTIIGCAALFALLTCESAQAWSWGAKCYMPAGFGVDGRYLVNMVGGSKYRGRLVEFDKKTCWATFKIEDLVMKAHMTTDKVAGFVIINLPPKVPTIEEREAHIKSLERELELYSEPRKVITE